MQVYEKTNDKLNIADLKRNLGVLFWTKEDYLQSKSYYQQAAQSFEDLKFAWVSEQKINPESCEFLLDKIKYK